MVTIDFSPGMHGHFLSYIINQYIFNIESPTINIFQTSGAAHFINIDQNFLDRRLVTHGHYSYFNCAYPSNVDRIVWIERDPELDFILLTNIYHRCHPAAVQGHDVNANDIKKLHHDDMFQDAGRLSLLRRNWYTKLIEYHLASSSFLKETKIPIFKFCYKSFFDLRLFINELSMCADFCNMTLNYNLDLVKLYHEFLERNQGYQQWVCGNRLLNSILTNENLMINPEDWQLQAYLNFNISKMFKLYSGDLFDNDLYPKNTQEIHQIITDFVSNYDSMF
jgi:hypothetical protein